MTRPTRYDAVIIGSGLGGAMAAWSLVHAGARVLMLERGDWVPRGPWNSAPEGVAMLSPHYTSSGARLEAGTDAGRYRAGAFHCVGGQSVFYGAVAYRYRAQDFTGDPGVLAGSGARWPFGYDELEPYYATAERLLAVSGVDGADPSEAPRSAPFPGAAPACSSTARALHDAARSLGLRSFRPPVAIRHGDLERPGCAACGACDGHACARGAKGDAAAVIAELIGRGLELRTRTVVTRLCASSGWVSAVEAVDERDGKRVRFHADAVVLAAGALATPHLLLASGLQRTNPGGRVVGRYLTRHCNAVVCGLFREAPGGGFVPFKEFAVQDFYFGHPGHPELGRLGGIQQTALPSALVAAQAPRLLRPLARAVLPHLVGLLAMGEDQPVATNRVELDRGHSDALGLPALRIVHHYTDRDRRVRHILAGEAARILRRAGAVLCVRRSVESFTHALGTVRMGEDPATSALDAGGRFRGVANLFVADGSALPTSAAVNPALTIAATALRTADRMSGTRRWTSRAIRSERREAAGAR